MKNTTTSIKGLPSLKHRDNFLKRMIFHSSHKAYIMGCVAFFVVYVVLCIIAYTPPVKYNSSKIDLNYWYHRLDIKR